MPVAVALALLTRVPLLPPTTSMAFPSPSQKPMIPAGGGKQLAAARKPEAIAVTIHAAQSQRPQRPVTEKSNLNMTTPARVVVWTAFRNSPPPKRTQRQIASLFRVGPRNRFSIRSEFTRAQAVLRGRFLPGFAPSLFSFSRLRSKKFVTSKAAGRTDYVQYINFKVENLSEGADLDALGLYLEKGRDGVYYGHH